MVVTDVAIVGAGPAGSTLAALLAARGCSVIAVDRDTFPRDKVCGEFLSYDALPIVERLGVDLRAAPPIDRCRIAGRRRTFEFPFPSPARGISRFLLDDLLVRSAAAAGAQIWQGCTASSVTAARLAAARDEIHATVVVGAWGRWGRFDAQLGRAFVRERAHRNFGFKRHYHAARSDDPSVISLFPFRRGYLGASAIEESRTNVCGLVHASRLGGSNGGWNALVSDIRSEEPRLDELFHDHDPAQEEFLSSTPVIFRARSAVEDGIFMIGDASGVIDPLTGSGMAMAIQSALLLAPYVLSALSGNRHDAERSYRRRHAGFFARRMAWSRRIAFLLSRPRLLDAALAFARPPAGPFLLQHTRGGRDEIERMCDEWFRSSVPRGVAAASPIRREES